MEIPMPTLRDAAVERCQYDGVPSECPVNEYILDGLWRFLVHRRWMTENSTIPDGLRRLMKEIDSHWRVERKVS
jgi:hypothetical protein